MNYPVKDIQEKLNRLGFGPLVVDGLKGPRTDAAIVAFKRSVGLRARPFVGPLTWAALMGQGKSSVPVFKGQGSGIPWMENALAVKGLHEARNYSQLRRWFSASVAWIDPREIAWCGAFVATAMRQWKPDVQIPHNPLGARNWGKFGFECKPQLGSVLTFWRGSRKGWKGHVGFYFGEDETAFHVLGGNQSDAVTVTRISRSRFLQSRWPKGEVLPGKQILLSPDGRPLSQNEA